MATGIIAVREFEYDLLCAENNAQRVEVARRHLAQLFPSSPERAARTTWQYVYLGYAQYGTRFALIETEAGKPGARLLVLRGKTIFLIRHVESAEAARRAAYAYEWTAAETAP